MSNNKKSAHKRDRKDLFSTEVRVEEKNGLVPRSPDFETNAWVYNNIDELSVHCRKLYFLFLTLLAYAVLTIATTPVDAFFFGQSIKLPVLSLKIPLYTFIILVPVASIGLFIYIQLYLMEVNKLIHFAIDKCQDANPGCCRNAERKCAIDDLCEEQKKRFYPWIVIFSRYSGKSWMEGCQKIFANFSLWWALPCVLVTFSLFVVKRHDIFLSTFMGTISIVCISIVFIFRQKYQSSLCGKKMEEKRSCLPVLCILSLCIILPLVTLNWVAWRGYILEDSIPYAKDTDMGVGWKMIRWVAFADFSGKDIHSYSEKDKNIALPYDLNLSGFHLEGANLSYTDLSQTDLSKAHLQYANFEGTNLKRSHLDYAVLKHANLSLANLIGASLNNAKLNDANLDSARLQAAILSQADLSHADFASADLLRALLSYADVKGADFRYADNVNKYQIHEATNWPFGIYSDVKPTDKDKIESLREKLGLPEDYYDRPDNGDLEAKEYYYRLANIDLKGVIFAGNMEKVNFTNADLELADLSQTEYVKPENLKKARNYQKAAYSENMLKELALESTHNDLIYQKMENDVDLSLTVRNRAATPNDIDWKNRKLKQREMACVILAKKNLSGFDLSMAKMKHADLREANLSQAKLSYTDFEFADLRGVIYNDIEQFSPVATMYRARLDRDLEIKLVETYPYLFVEPTERQ